MSWGFLILKSTGSGHSQIWTGAKRDNRLSPNFHWGPFLPGPLFQAPNLTSPNPRWQRWGRDSLRERTGWEGSGCGLHWGAKLCQLCPGLFHWTRHLRVFSVLAVRRPSQSLVSGQGFLLVALISQPEFWGLFLFPSPFPKVLKRQNPGFLKSNSKAVSAQVANALYLIAEVSSSPCRTWFWTCSRLRQLNAIVQGWRALSWLEHGPPERTS